MAVGTGNEGGKEAMKKLEESIQKKIKDDLQEVRKKDAEEAFKKKQLAFQQELEKFKQSRISSTPGPDGKPQEETDWQRSTRKGKEGSSSETSAYNSEWKIAMLGLVGMLVEWNKALNNSVTEFLMAPTFAIKHQLLPQLWDKISSRFTSDPAVNIPILLHHVKMNDKNVLEVKLTLDAQLHPAPDTFDSQFERVVVEWLKEEGYRPDPDPAKKGQFVNSKGETLTAEAFNDLKDDPYHGMQHFLTETSELQFRPSM